MAAAAEFRRILVARLRLAQLVRCAADRPRSGRELAPLSAYDWLTKADLVDDQHRDEANPTQARVRPVRLRFLDRFTGGGRCPDHRAGPRPRWTRSVATSDGSLQVACRCRGHGSLAESTSLQTVRGRQTSVPQLAAAASRRAAE